MAAMGLLLKSSLPPLKCRRNPLLRTTTTTPHIISLPSSSMMIIKNSNTTRISLPKITSSTTTSSSNRGSAALIRVQCVMNNNSEKKNCFKKKEEQLEEENDLVLKGLERIAVVVVFVWGVLLKKNLPTAIFLGLWLSYDLCKAICPLLSQYSRTREINGEPTYFPIGPVLFWIFPLLSVIVALLGGGVTFICRGRGRGGDSHSSQGSDDMDKLSSKIKVHEENIRIMKSQSDKLDESILDMRGIQLKGLLDKMPLDWASTEDVLGFVALLGTVDDDNLSRIFSEYLGLETMMTIVCKTTKSLETCYKEVTSIRRPIDGRFQVICLEGLRPYAGDFVAEDPQRRLALLKPRLPSGECPPGFLGFAVNMINLDKLNLHYVTSNGNGLRETLFYSLFSHLQVYRTRAEMQLALPCISDDGAVSLDGGMIRRAGVFSMGTRKDVEVKFMISSGTSTPLVYCKNAKEKIKIMKSDKKKLLEDMQREQTLLNHVKVVKHSAESKRQELLKFLAELEHESATNSDRS